jgi:hypothetical protein
LTQRNHIVTIGESRWGEKGTQQDDLVGDLKLMALTVGAKPGALRQDEQWVVKAVEACLKDHLGERELVGDSNLTATVEECVGTEDRAKISVFVTGTIKGKQLSQTFRVNRHLGATRHSGTGVAYGLGRIVGRAVTEVAGHTLGVVVAQEALAQVVEECAADIALKIDELCGHIESEASARWAHIVIARWAGAALAMAAFIFVVVSRAGQRGIGVSLILGTFLAVAAFWLIHVLGLLTMPRSFFERDPRGKKAMARAGVQTVPAVRGLCAVLAIVLAAIAAGVVLGTIDLLNRLPGE